MNQLFARVCAPLAIVCVGLAGFFSPLWWVGFAGLAAGLVWAYYDVVDVEGEHGDTPAAPRPR